MRIKEKMLNITENMEEDIEGVTDILKGTRLGEDFDLDTLRIVLETVKCLRSDVGKLENLLDAICKLY